MKLSAKAEYACVALVELANRHQRGLPTSIKVIAEHYGISQPFLMQIFLQLKGAGLVVSIRGAGGGYQLARSPDNISLLDVIDVIDGPPPADSGISSAETPQVIALRSVWHKVRDAERAILAATSLAEIQRRSQEKDVLHFHI